MNFCAIQPNSFAAGEEFWATATAITGKSLGKRETVVCPKPRRLGLAPATLDPSFPSPMWWHMSHPHEDCDSRAGNELLDLILAKGNRGNSEQPPVAGSPPFFPGSPPGRVSNPLIQDERFGDEKHSPESPPYTVVLPQSPSSNRKGGCVVRASFGNKPATRVEGFDCLGWDRRNCSVPTLA